jgi:hypothetical protein
MTKGFLARHYPEIDRTLLTFRVTQLDQFKVNDAGFEKIREALYYFQRGDGVYFTAEIADEERGLFGLITED